MRCSRPFEGRWRDACGGSACASRYRRRRANVHTTTSAAISRSFRTESTSSDSIRQRTLRCLAISRQGQHRVRRQARSAKGVDHLIAAVPGVIERTRATRAFPDRRRFVPARQTRGAGSCRHARTRDVHRSGARRRTAALVCDRRHFRVPRYRQRKLRHRIAEAMATGRPVVCSDIAGYRTVVTHDHNALLHPPATSQR